MASSPPDVPARSSTDRAAGPSTSERLGDFGLLLLATLAAGAADRVAPPGTWGYYAVVGSAYGAAASLSLGFSNSRHRRVAALEQRLGRWRTSLLFGALVGALAAAFYVGGEAVFR